MKTKMKEEKEKIEMQQESLEFYSSTTVGCITHFSVPLGIPSIPSGDHISSLYLHHGPSVWVSFKGPTTTPQEKKMTVII